MNKNFFALVFLGVMLSAVFFLNRPASAKTNKQKLPAATAVSTMCSARGPKSRVHVSATGLLTCRQASVTLNRNVLD